MNALNDFNPRSESSCGKLNQLKKYLNEASGRSSDVSSLLGSLDSHEDGSSQSSSTGDVDPDQPELRDLDRVKIFILESAAYVQFKHELTNFIMPRNMPGEQESTHADTTTVAFQSRWHRLKAKGIEVCNALRMLSRRLVPPGLNKDYLDMCESKLNLCTM